MTGITEDAYSFLQGVPLQKPSKILHRPGHKPLTILGEFTLKLQCRDKTTNQHIFVHKHLGRNLLGPPGILAFDVIATVDTVRDYKTAIRKAHPKVFQGLGQFGDLYRIKLQTDAQPEALFTSRKVQLPLRHKVEEELCRMEAQGIISKVDEPTTWCSGMVPTLKKSGSVCMDLQRLNSNVLRQVHLLPRVDETLGQLAGAEVFSRSDANSEFWQYLLQRNLIC